MDTQALAPTITSRAFAGGDTDTALEDYTDDSVLFTPDGVVRGREALRLGTDTFVVRGTGKIAVQTFAALIETR